MKEIDNNTLRKIADDIFNLYQKEKNGLSYGANVIDELHAGENAHSRILRMLLQYESEGKRPIYSSFLALLSNKCDDISKLRIISPKFTNEEERIDVLVKDYSHSCPYYAIIIENKVCGATDQDQQIQRYIDKIIKDCFPIERIFVVYLTKDGEKIVSEDSLTKEAKQILGVSESSMGRYIPLDYKNHILPWLENEVLPNLTIKERILVSSIQLYIDYLKGILNIRDNDKQITNKLYIKMKNDLNIGSLKESIELYQKVDLLKETSSNLLNMFINETLERNLYQPLLDAFPGSEIVDKRVQEKCFGFTMKIQEWKNCQIVVDWDPRQYYAITHINVETNPIDDDTRESIHKVLPDGKNTNWSPWWNHLKKRIDSADSINIWNDVEKGTVFRFFKDWISDVINKTKDIPGI